MPPIQHWQLNVAPATPRVGYVYISGVTANTETIVINGRTYEFTDGALVGDVQINVPNGSNAAVSITGAVAAINGDAARTVEAIDLGGDVMGLIGRTPGAAALTLAETMGNGAVSAAVMTGGAADAYAGRVFGEYTVTAQDVTTLASGLGTAQIGLFGFPSTTQPAIVNFQVRTATGVLRNMTDGIVVMRQINANQWMLCYVEPAGGALLVATDIVSFDLAVRGA